MRDAVEFSRTVRIDTLGTKPRAIAIEAKAAERAALAERFGLTAIGHLAADAELSRNGEQVTASGRVRAHVVQSCVVTAGPVDEQVDEEFTILFRPQPRESGGEGEIELGEGELDVVFYHGASIDMGEVVAETLALALDPYPRAPDAAAALKRADVKGDAEATAEEKAKAARSPFAALRRD